MRKPCVSLQNALPLSEFCDIMFLPGKYNQIPQKRCDAGCLAEKPRDGNWRGEIGGLDPPLVLWTGR